MMQFMKKSIFCCITWFYIVSNVPGYSANPKVHDISDIKWSERLQENLGWYNKINQSNKWYERERKKIDPHHNNILTIKIQDENHQLVIEFEEVDHNVANKHLPIWKTSSEYLKEYEKMYNVMHYVGDFTMYRDYKTNSALVYFHNRKELDGVINQKFYIRKLPVGRLHEVHKVNHKYVFLQGHDLSPNDDNVSDNRGTKDHGTSGRKTYQRRSLELAPEVFPEFLIAIGYDMFIAIEQDSKYPLGVSTVSHVLVIFNAVDMLYQSVQAARININIAGIVIEASEDHWGFVKSLAIGESIEHGVRVKSILDAENITSMISDHFRKMENYFPRDSYDFIIYNTRNQLTYASVNVMGMAWHSGFSYMYPAGQDYDRINVATQDHKSYAHFVVIAHEIAHMMNVEHDPTNGTSKDNRTLGDSLMSCYEGQCVHGLSWSEASEETFRKYFRSPAHCILKNPPRSLHQPKPRKTLTVLEQCQCYGFHAFKKPDLGDECNEPNGCLNGDKENLIHVTQLPMDGTPCGNYSWNYICWEEKCIHPDHWIPNVPV